MYNDSSSPTLTNCSFDSNASGTNGGAMHNADSSPSLSNCSFLNNAARNGNGGCVYNTSNSSPSLTNCLFLSNTANNGGGMYNFVSSNPILTNCSFLNNFVKNSGVSMANFSNSNPTLTNCVLFEDRGQNTIVNSGNSTLTATYSLFEATETDYTGSNNLTTTVSPFDSFTSAQLRFCSPAIDEGDDSANGTVTDLAGNPRKLRTIDMGAYEFQGAFSPYTATLSGGGTISLGGSANLIVTLSGGSDPYAVVYSDGSANATVPHYTSGANIPISPTVTTTYTLVSVEDRNDCVASTLSGSATVIVQTPPIRYVDANRPDDIGNGLSWAKAHKYLQTALTAAQSGDQIWVAQGTYKPTTSTTDRTKSFIMKEGVKIYGGFNSGQLNMTDRDTNPATNGTVLSGDINSDNALSGNSYHVIFNDQNGLSAAAVLDGFTVMGGNANGVSFPNNRGGGIFNFSSNPTLANCSFQGNSAEAGGGLYDRESAPTLNYCTFQSNYANEGGGIANFLNSSPILTNCSFHGNFAINAGGMFNRSGSSPTLTNCLFQSNSATSSGGAWPMFTAAPRLPIVLFKVILLIVVEGEYSTSLQA
ncbi:right-handed parallel beta-helix repeat-containing protein [Salmonirosea aquatica]|uniref:Right handed beta helix domain-containing protein n=1 Tax=Salmonirosea aquatica TaxID=2654236 RepID=A0A7C9FB08_9BACT|nr:hypothetical protein [Cytophagaceae bacterium SJW1-29]